MSTSQEIFEKINERHKLLACHICGEPAKGICDICDKPMCSDHRNHRDDHPTGEVVFCDGCYEQSGGSYR